MGETSQLFPLFTFIELLKWFQDAYVYDNYKFDLVMLYLDMFIRVYFSDDFHAQFRQGKSFIFSCIDLKCYNISLFVMDRYVMPFGMNSLALTYALGIGCTDLIFVMGNYHMTFKLILHALVRWHILHV